jgi:hypothetical protein
MDVRTAMSQSEKHLEFLQSVISRLARNSFLIKGWTVTLVAALFALASKDTEAGYVIVAYLPTVMFWALDAYYLRQERLFRALYDQARTSREIDFSMDTSVVEQEVSSWLGVAFSRTILLFYGILIATIVVVMLSLN